MAVLTPEGVRLSDFDGRPVKRQVTHILWDPIMAEKGGYKHFMLKEIFEQPRAVRDTTLGRVGQETGRIFLDEMDITPRQFQNFKQVRIVACGTSWHAALVAKRYVEELAGMRASADIASEYRYRPPLPVRAPGTARGNVLAVAISQSGETADTLAALRSAAASGARVLGVVNVVGSSIAREAEGVLYTRAGPEISVASTKAFATQVAALLLLAADLGRLRRTLDDARARAVIGALERIPEKLDALVPAAAAEAKELAPRLAEKAGALYLGRGYGYPLALEGALKMKEITYIHAEGYPAGEMKHGPIALVGPSTAVVAVAPQDRLHAKTLGNIEEVKARDGFVVAVGTEGDRELAALADAVFWVPAADEALYPLLAAAPLQLLAYEVSVALGRDVDRPRNLAKSVTVE
jgi:glucosamine--fructose-6-phosphate aminotransferase (isomerizing)